MAKHERSVIGPVTLTVRDLEKVSTFYRERLGLAELKRDATAVTLGAGDTPLVILEQRPDAVRPAGMTTGLYHLAILLPSRVELAKALRHLAQTQTEIHGVADHLVSEAIYLADP